MRNYQPDDGTVRQIGHSRIEDTVLVDNDMNLGFLELMLTTSELAQRAGTERHSRETDGTGI